MLPVIHSMSVSLDGFIAGPGGDIGWSAPDAEQFGFHVEQTHHIAAHLCGRGLYEAMLVWETAEQTMSGEAELEFARIWRPIPKVVFSRTLNSVVGTARLATDDIATEVGRLRDQPGDGVVSIGGAGLAAGAIAEDLNDEYRQFANPVVLGNGTPYFPPLAKPLDLRLTESQTLSSRVGYLRYQRIRRVRRPGGIPVSPGRELFYGQRGELHQHYREGQEVLFSALGMVLQGGVRQMSGLIRLNPDVAHACRELGLQVKLDGSKRVYWDIRWRREVELMWLRLNGNRTRFYTFRTIAVVSSVLIPALVALNLDGQAGVTVRWITFTLSALAGIATAVSGLFRASERWAINRRYLSPLYGEGVRFATLTAGYERFETHDAAFDRFSLAVEEILDQFAAEFDRDFLLFSAQRKPEKEG